MDVKQRTGGVSFRIDAVEDRTDGSIRVKGRLTKTGVFEYQRDGLAVRELRSEDEVFSEDALESLQRSWVTVDHPPDFLNVKNWKDYAVGRVDTVAADPPYVSGTMSIWDPTAIHQIKTKVLKEVSCGYACVPETLDSADADISQTRLTYNHVAIGPEKWGRLGSDVSLRLDSNGQEILTPFEANTEETSMENIQEAIEPVLEAIRVLDAKYASLAETLEAQAEEHQTQDSPIEKFDSLPDGEKVERMVRERVDALLKLELEARDAAQEVCGWRIDSRTGQWVPDSTYRVSPVLCGRKLCEAVLQTVDSDRTIGDDEDLVPLVREAMLLGKKARQDRLAQMTTVDSLERQMNTIKAHTLQARPGRVSHTLAVQPDSPIDGFFANSEGQ